LQVEHATKAGIFPTFELIEQFHLQSPLLGFPQLLELLREKIRLDKLFFLVDFEQQIRISHKIEDVNLTLREKYNFSLSPTDKSDEVQLNNLHHYAKSLAAAPHRVKFSMVKPLDNLPDLECNYKLADIYLWLGYALVLCSFTNAAGATIQRILSILSERRRHKS
jgi:hypothetical protein